MSSILARSAGGTAVWCIALLAFILLKKAAYAGVGFVVASVFPNIFLGKTQNLRGLPKLLLNSRINCHGRISVIKHTGSDLQDTLRNKRSNRRIEDRRAIPAANILRQVYSEDVFLIGAELMQVPAYEVYSPVEVVPCGQNVNRKENSNYGRNALDNSDGNPKRKKSSENRNEDTNSQTR